MKEKRIKSLSMTMRTMLVRMYCAWDFHRFPPGGRSSRGWQRTLRALRGRGLVFLVGKGDRFWDQSGMEWNEATESGGWSLTETGYDIASAMWLKREEETLQQAKRPSG